MYLGTEWKKSEVKGERTTFVNAALQSRLLVQGERGVVMGVHGLKKVKVSVSGDVATVVTEDANVFRGGHEVKEWLSGKESEELSQWVAG